MTMANNVIEMLNYVIAAQPTAQLRDR